MKLKNNKLINKFFLQAKQKPFDTRFKKFKKTSNLNPKKSGFEFHYFNFNFKYRLQN